ncbi:MAG: alpha/beta hydrolase [Firmicutes bacterium]|nr:alpha/beta hydrolase [Bacillota bacterium]
MKKRTIIAGTISAATVAAGVSVFRYFSDMAVTRKQPRIPFPVQILIDRSQDDDLFDPVVEALQEDIRDIPFEELTQESNDGLLLKGRLYLPENPKRIIVFMHGWRSSWQKDFSIVVLPLLEMGCGLFFADQRAHGQSEGEYITYGVKEREDCALWADLLGQRFADLPLYLWGMSMGSTTVMMAAGQRGLPDHLRGVIADCGFTNPMEEIRHLIRHKVPGGANAIATLYRHHILHRCGFDMDAINTRDVLAKTEIPFLFFHGEEDRFVPTEMTFRNFVATASEKEMVIVEGAVHSKSFHMDPERCLNKVSAFFEKHDM